MNPTKPQSHQSYIERERGRAYYRLGRYELAIEAFVKGLGDSPQIDAYAHSMIALCWNALKQYGRAERCLAEAMACWPEFSFGWHVLSIIQNNKGDGKNATKSNAEALRLDPAYLEAIVFKIHRLCDKKKYKQAEAESARGLALYPHEPELLRAAARNCICAKKYAKAKSILDAALRIEPESSDAHYYLGCYFQNVRNFKDAEASYRESLRIDPTNRVVQNHLYKIPKKSRSIGVLEGILMLISSMAYFLFYVSDCFPKSLMTHDQYVKSISGVALLPVLIYGIFEMIEDKKKRTKASVKEEGSVKRTSPNIGVPPGPRQL